MAALSILHRGVASVLQVVLRQGLALLVQYGSSVSVGVLLCSGVAVQVVSSALVFELISQPSVAQTTLQ